MQVIGSKLQSTLSLSPNNSQTLSFLKVYGWIILVTSIQLGLLELSSDLEIGYMSPGSMTSEKQLSAIGKSEKWLRLT